VAKQILQDRPVGVRCRQRAPALWLAVLLIAAVGCSAEPADEGANANQNVEAVVQSQGDPVGKADDAAPPTVTLSPPELLTREQIEAGWISLFDGQTLFGWEANSNVNWSVVDGEIRADKGEPGLLLTTAPFADFELRCDFWFEAGGNSGVFLRTLFDPSDPARDCYELNICDSHPQFPTGSLVGRAKVSSPIEAEGSWKSYYVRAEGNRIEAQLDGETILEFEDDTDAIRAVGFIGLQKNSGAVAFRNVLVRPLGLQSVFNGTDLAGWRQVPGSQSNFEVTGGSIRVTDGPGFLETEQVWDDFILQADVRVNGKRLNSGIFFRAMPGTQDAPSNGYEFQIQNGFENGDRTQPADAGTGAIFRRAAARYVVPNDEEWFTITLAAHGSRLSSWVNGYPVVDWEDTREPNENPRRGLRLDAGHISLQGHDPTTDLQFKNLRLAPIRR